MTSNPDVYSVLKENTHRNRTALTAAESFLWEHIRRKALGVKFRRQVPIGDYIADFMDTDTKIIIEVDGEYHNTPEQIYYDNLRTDYLNKHGYYVMRFKNEEILGDIRSVTEKIKYLIDKTRK